MAPKQAGSGRDKPPQKTAQHNPEKLCSLTVTHKDDILIDAPPPAVNPWTSSAQKRPKPSAPGPKLNMQDFGSLQSDSDNARETNTSAVATKDESSNSKDENDPAKAPNAAEEEPKHDAQNTKSSESQKGTQCEVVGDTPLPVVEQPQNTSTDAAGDISAGSDTHPDEQSAGSLAPTIGQTGGLSHALEAFSEGKTLDEEAAHRPGDPFKLSNPPKSTDPSMNPSQDGEPDPKPSPGPRPGRDQSAEAELDRSSTDSDSSSSASIPAQADTAQVDHSMLWHYPQGADVRVFSFAPNMHSHAHRHIIIEHSGWYRQHLPPPNQDGSPVDILVNCCPSAVISSLYFMYSGRLEWCETQDISDSRYLPQCVLSYCASVYFRIPTMMHYVLNKIKSRARDLRAELVSISLKHGEQAVGQFFHYSYAHLQDAFDIAYAQADQDVMKPLRLALAYVWDRVAPFLMCHSSATEAWKAHQGKVMLDVLEFRRLCEATPGAPSPWNLDTPETIRAFMEKPSIQKGTQPGSWVHVPYLVAPEQTSPKHPHGQTPGAIMPSAP